VIDDSIQAVTKPAPVKSVVASSSSSVPYNQAPISNNRTAAAFTSSAQTVSTKSQNALWDEEYLMYEEVQKRGEKGYARMVSRDATAAVDRCARRELTAMCAFPSQVTNFGSLNFEVRHDTHILG
jgi:phosphoketolase